MSVATSTAIAIAAGVGGAASVTSAAMQSRAAGHAADIQGKAAEEALAFTKEQKAKQEAAAAPYLALGGMAAGRLPGVVRPMPAYGAPAPYTTQPQATSPVQPAGQPMAALGQPGAGMGGLVMVQAPTGETMRLPQAQAQQAVSRGARIVG